MSSVKSNNHAALANYQERLSHLQWGLYRVERTYEKKIGSESKKPFTRVDRRVVMVSRGSREQMTANLQAIAQEHNLTVETSLEAERVYSHRRDPKVFPSCEGFWVVCPALVKNKVRSVKSFQQKWDEITGAVRQLTLF